MTSFGMAGDVQQYWKERAAWCFENSDERIKRFPPQNHCPALCLVFKERELRIKRVFRVYGSAVFSLERFEDLFDVNLEDLTFIQENKFWRLGFKYIFQ